MRAIPGAGLNVPLWLLGSSLFSARLAAALGLPFAFASHFAPDLLLPALDTYRKHFEPSDALAAPYALVGVNVFAADTDAEAKTLFTSLLQLFVNLVRGTPGPLPPPVAGMENLWSPTERANAERMTRCSAVGSPETVRNTLETLQAETGADELMVTAHIFDHAARLRSFQLAAEVWGISPG